jgi:quercetin dioxygenase-like cupin family protein
MKRVVIAGVVIVAAMGIVRAQQSSSMKEHAGHVVYTPDAIKWGPAPAALPPGAHAMVLHGDPGKAGQIFVVRLHFPDGYKVPPHYHPVDENVTVLKGTLMLGLGEKADLASAKAMAPGSFSYMPKEVRHFAQAKGETEIQVSGVGPFDVVYVNPADDPRKKAGSN